MLYIEDKQPEMSDASVLRDWERFLTGAPIQKSYPHDGSLRWVQIKYNSMGACALAIELCSSTDEAVCQAAFRLLRALLQGSNRETQNTIFEELSTKREQRFFFTCHRLLAKASLQISTWAEHRKKSVLADTGISDESEFSLLSEMLRTFGAPPHPG